MKAALLLAIVLIAWLVPDSHAQSGADTSGIMMYVQEDALLYGQPISTTKTVGVVPMASVVYALTNNDHFVKIRWSGNTGWVKREVLGMSRPDQLPQLLRTAPEIQSPQPSTTEREDPQKNCCRICKSGCACGNSCISCSKTCRQPPGCAC
jgi:hypothetical protein